MLSLVYPLLFHKSGKPRRVVRSILFHRNKKIRKSFTRLVLKKNGSTRSLFAPWLRGAQAQNAAVEAMSTAINIMSEVKGLDPDFIGITYSIEQGKLHFRNGVRHDGAAKAWKKLFASLAHSYKRIIFVPWLIRGGADLVAVYAARAAIEKYGAESLLLVVTDSSRIEASDWLPNGTHMRVLSDYGSDLSFNDRIELSSWLIQALKPRSILNVNSRACWEVIRTRGAALSTFCDIYAALFCRDYNSKNEADGYADLYFRSALTHLKRIYFDNKAFADEIAEQFAVPPSLRNRLFTVYQPAPVTTNSDSP